MFLTFIAFVVVLGVLILVHELGHFVAAKLTGVKVLEFSIGFPPRLFSFTKGETKYTIGLLPFGGYVNMLGENDASKDPRSYNSQTPGKRALIGVAGVTMNVVLAWIILTIGFIAGMTPMATPSSQIPAREVRPQIFVAEVVAGSAAESAGIKLGDQLIGSGEETFGAVSEVSEFTKLNSGRSVSMKLKRNNEVSEVLLNLAEGSEAPLGVGLVDQGIVKVDWWKAPGVALRESTAIVRYTFSFLGSFVSQLFREATISDSVGGPVAIYSLSGAAARGGAIIFLQFIAVLSLNLALINILPLPALDGGRVLFIALEKTFGKRIVKEELEGLIHSIGFVLLLLLIVAVTYKDIVRLIQK